MAEEEAKSEANQAEKAAPEQAQQSAEQQPKQEGTKAEDDAGKEVKGPRPEDPLANWSPKTRLGKEVFEGRLTTIDDVFASGRRIIEPEIVDKMLPDLKNELILIGSRGGKGGGGQRIPVRITAAMHKSGRRFHMSSLVAVGNEDGIVGIAEGRAPETRDAMRKATERAKTTVMPVRRGCGSWECGCGMGHSVPYKVTGKRGSVYVELIPAPKGVGIVASDDAKKMFRLAGIKDIWVKTRGNTSMRINLTGAIYDALRKLYEYERGGR